MFIKYAVKYLLLTVLSIISVWGSADLSLRAIILLHGRIPLQNIFLEGSHRYVFFASLLWLTAFSSVSCTLIHIIKWKLSRHNNLPYWVGGAAGALCFWPYHLILTVGRYE